MPVHAPIAVSARSRTRTHGRAPTLVGAGVCTFKVRHADKKAQAVAARQCRLEPAHRPHVLLGELEQHILVTRRRLHGVERRARAHGARECSRNIVLRTGQELPRGVGGGGRVHARAAAPQPRARVQEVAEALRGGESFVKDMQTAHRVAAVLLKGPGAGRLARELGDVKRRLRERRHRLGDVGQVQHAHGAREVRLRVAHARLPRRARRVVLDGEHLQPARLHGHGRRRAAGGEHLEARVRHAEAARAPAEAVGVRRTDAEDVGAARAALEHAQVEPGDGAVEPRRVLELRADVEHRHELARVDEREREAHLVRPQRVPDKGRARVGNDLEQLGGVLRHGLEQRRAAPRPEHDALGDEVVDEPLAHGQQRREVRRRRELAVVARRPDHAQHELDAVGRALVALGLHRKVVRVAPALVARAAVAGPDQHVLAHRVEVARGRALRTLVRVDQLARRVKLHARVGAKRRAKVPAVVRARRHRPGEARAPELGLPEPADRAHEVAGAALGLPAQRVAAVLGLHQPDAQLGLDGTPEAAAHVPSLQRAGRRAPVAVDHVAVVTCLIAAQHIVPALHRALRGCQRGQRGQRRQRGPEGPAVPAPHVLHARGNVLYTVAAACRAAAASPRASTCNG